LTVPNIVSSIRIVLIPAFLVCLRIGQPMAAMLLFAGISLTDYLDGWLARKLDQVTDLGKVLDPLADKLLVTAAIVAFVAQGQMEDWMALIIIGREMIISTLRVVAASKGQVLAAGWSGKVKTFLQMMGILFILSPWNETVIPGTEVLWIAPVAWVMTAVSLWSGVDYMWKHRKILSDA